MMVLKLLKKEEAEVSSLTDSSGAEEFSFDEASHMFSSIGKKNIQIFIFKMKNKHFEKKHVSTACLMIREAV